MLTAELISKLRRGCNLILSPNDAVVMLYTWIFCSLKFISNSQPTHIRYDCMGGSSGV